MTEPGGPDTWAVVGASGFVGSAVVAELRALGRSVKILTAPRLETAATTAGAIVVEARAAVERATDDAAAAPEGAPGSTQGLPAHDLGQLREALLGVDVLVNAAGLATPGGGDSPALTGANALLPAVLATMAEQAGVRRFVHLSSASVQGQLRTIDESSRRAPFSPYSRSKALGEEALELLTSVPDTRSGSAAAESVLQIVTVRATSVQGPTRPTTQSLVKIARSPLATVASPGTARTPVSSITALAKFVAATGEFAGSVQAIVLQPWEGLSVREVLSAAGGRSPMVLPAWFCRMTLKLGYGVSERILRERLHGPLRRVELMWFGQGQEAGWAESVGLVPEASVAQVLAQARG